MEKMKRSLLILLAGFTCQIASAQYGVNGIYASSSNSQVVVLENLGTRDVLGGTIIKPTFVGTAFTPTIRNAFNYACRLWEEKIPTAYPINISVRMEHLLDNTALAVATANYLESCAGTERALEKRLWQVNMGCTNGNDFETGIDAVITFNADMPFDYNTDATRISPLKYDFITVAIQAIGKALGLYMQVYYDGTNITPTTNYPNVYTRYVLNGYRYDYNVAPVNYQSLVSNGKYIEGMGQTNWPLYCPDVYNPKYSLSYFVIDSSENETLAMQPGIAKGTAIRYIGKGIESVLYQCGWMETGLVTGMGGETYVSSASTANVIPYVANNSTGNNLKNKVKTKSVKAQETSTLYDKRERQAPGKYVLKKDGSWESYTSLASFSPDDSTYARTVDGYLRLMKVSYSYGVGGRYLNYEIQHSLYHFPPQKPKYQLNSYTPSNVVLNSSQRFLRRAQVVSTVQVMEDEFIDVEIGFEDTEGCKEILVEQTDSDWPTPYTYYADPSDGYIVAFMNKRYPSTIRLTYINDEGQSIGDAKVFDFTNETNASTPLLDVKKEGNSLLLELSKSDNGRYVITDVRNGRIYTEGDVVLGRSKVDVLTIPNGIYTVSVITNGKTVSTKWVKQ